MSESTVHSFEDEVKSKEVLAEEDVKPERGAVKTKKGRRGKKKKHHGQSTDSSNESNTFVDADDTDVSDYVFKRPHRLLRPVDVPKAPLNSTQFIIDDHINETCHLYYSFDTPDPHRRSDDFKNKSDESYSDIDICREYEPVHNIRSHSNFELDYYNARYEILMSLSKTDLVASYQKLEARVKKVEYKLFQVDPNAALEQLQQKLLHLQEENSMLKKHQLQLQKMLKSGKVKRVLLSTSSDLHDESEYSHDEPDSTTDLESPLTRSECRTSDPLSLLMSDHAKVRPTVDFSEQNEMCQSSEDEGVCSSTRMDIPESDFMDINASNSVLIEKDGIHLIQSDKGMPNSKTFDKNGKHRSIKTDNKDAIVINIDDGSTKANYDDAIILSKADNNAVLLIAEDRDNVSSEANDDTTMPSRADDIESIPNSTDDRGSIASGTDDGFIQTEMDDVYTIPSGADDDIPIAINNENAVSANVDVSNRMDNEGIKLIDNIVHEMSGQSSPSREIPSKDDSIERMDIEECSSSVNVEQELPKSDTKNVLCETDEKSEVAGKSGKHPPFSQQCKKLKSKIKTSFSQSVHGIERSETFECGDGVDVVAAAVCDCGDIGCTDISCG